MFLYKHHYDFYFVYMSNFVKLYYEYLRLSVNLFTVP